MELMGVEKRRIKNIVYLSKQNLDTRNFERFGLELFEQNGFGVEYWDLTPILYPVVFKSYKPSDYINYKGLRIFYDEEELYKLLINLNNDTFIIDTVGFSFNFIKLYKALSKSRADYALAVSPNALPDIRDTDKSRNFYSILFRKIKNLLEYSPQDLWKKRILSALPLTIFGIKPARFILAGGNRCITKHHNPINKNTEILWIHAYDYDLYLKELNNQSSEQPIAVFLDIYHPFHTDRLYDDVISDVNPEEYYNLLNNFFNIIEKELNLEVVIAAHPRSDYDNMPNYFRGRKCIKGQTASLVKQSSLVLTQHSTALNLANLFYKPIVFITYSNFSENSIIQVMAELHGKNPIFIDRNLNIDWKQELTVSTDHYNNYRQAFIKTKNSPNLPTWQIVADRLKEI